jgi:transposase
MTVLYHLLGMKIRLGDPIMRPLTDEQIESLRRRDLVVLIKGEQKIRAEYEKVIAELQQKIDEKQRLTEELAERVLEIEGILCRVRGRLFAPSSERSPSRGRRGHSPKPPKDDPKAPVTRLPSERYPQAEIIEKDITLEQAPSCKCCGYQMTDSGMVETAEQLTVIPKRYVIVRELRHKYRCTRCHGSIVTAPPLPKIIPGGSYSDELIADAALSKFCDLIPMERYSQMAKRQGFGGIPPQSLIGVTFKLAEFFFELYQAIREETLASEVLLADETPHRMLEGDEKSKWFLWGFSNATACFYECHDNRSGEVASAVLAQSTCKVLLTDVYSGYRRAVREANEKRAEEKLPAIVMAFCNSHARREFKPLEAAAEAAYMIEQYREIYRLDGQIKEHPDKAQEIRSEMRPHFEAMREHCEKHLPALSEKSALGKAKSYFLNNYAGLTLFLSNPAVPIDNNASERLLRSHVVGRKTWYGTHSKDGAKAAAIHFTLIETCKLNGVNPRAYYHEMIHRIHASRPLLTPHQFIRIQAGAAPPALPISP